MSDEQNPNNPYPQYPAPGQTQNGQAPQSWDQQTSAPPQQSADSGQPVWEQQGGYSQLPPDVAKQLQDEMNQVGGNRGVQFSDVKYYKPKKPTTIGQTTASVIRLLWGWKGESTPPWYKHWRHFCMVTLDDGRQMRLPRGCPAKNTPLNQPPRPCPICERQARAAEMGDKQTADVLKPRSQFLLNVLDAENQDVHFATDPQTGATVVRAMVYGVGSTLFKKIGHIIGARGPICDRKEGRYIKIWATKTGKEDRDVRYDAIDCSDNCELPPGFEQVQLLPLDQLEPDKSYQVLAKEISMTYPDAPRPGVSQAPHSPQAGFQAQPPYGNPYPPQQLQQAPQAQPWQQAPHSQQQVSQGQPQMPTPVPQTPQPQPWEQSPQSQPPQNGEKGGDTPF